MKKVILDAYRILKNVTPLEIDCGLLCEAACCFDVLDSYDEDDVSGMLLFPGEEELFSNCSWGKLYDTEFVLANGRVLKLFVCEDGCAREERPLSCRIFPLFVDLKGNVIVDPRSKGLCPLSCFKPNEEFSQKFVSKVKEAFDVLMMDEECKLFVELMNDEFKYYLF